MCILFFSLRSATERRLCVFHAWTQAPHIQNMFLFLCNSSVKNDTNACSNKRNSTDPLCHTIDRSHKNMLLICARLLSNAFLYTNKPSKRNSSYLPPPLFSAGQTLWSSVQVEWMADVSIPPKELEGIQSQCYTNKIINEWMQGQGINLALHSQVLVCGNNTSH